MEIADLVKHVEAMGPDDTRTIEAWKTVRDKAPTVWAALKPVVDTVIGEAVKRALGL